MDDELLQDFLVEAGEILEKLSEQLVDLEQSPDDTELLNAVFRGFHTIKGGAGFLAIEPMVALCHRAEDVFNLLRNGERQIDAVLMDTMLPVLDVLNEQFEKLRNEEEPDPADPAMLASLEALTLPPGSAEVSAPATEEAPPATPDTAPQVEAKAGASASDDITDDEFDALLDALENPSAPGIEIKPDVPPAAKSSDEITDDEFESLLDDIHGEGAFDSAKAAAAAKESTPKDAEPAPAAAKNAASKGDEITDDEFESLLDDLHGKDKVTAKSSEKPTAAAPPPPAKAKPAKAPAAKDKPTAETSVRVDTARLDDIMNLVGELVLARNRISRLGSLVEGEDMQKAVANLDLVTSDLQLSVMKTRMQPIKKVFGRFPRVVRDMARTLKKEIKLEMQGEDTDLDKNLVEALSDPLVHLVRNSVDHGIEMPEDRVKAGKPKEGVVTLKAAQEGDHILLVIEDDGKGMDPEVLRKIAVEKGLMDAETAARMTDHDCFNLIFAPGFSTKKEISDISGRGVGMDVVKTRIAQLNGTVEIDSVLDKGTRISIKVPLTLAIMSTLMVKLETQLFALPLVSVSEIFHLDLTRTNVMDGKLVVLVRERTLPLFYLNHWLVKGQKNAEVPKEGHVVVVHIGNQRVGFVVDELIGQEEVVIKPLGALLHGTMGLAGATITGDGGIALILDVPGLMQRYA